MSTVTINTPGDGIEHVRHVAAAIFGLAKGAQADPRVVEYVRSIPAWGFSKAVFNFARGRMEFAADAGGVDTMRTVSAMWDDIAQGRTLRGDCAHRATLIGAMLEAKGNPWGLIFWNVGPGAWHVAAGVPGYSLDDGPLGRTLLALDPQESERPYYDSPRLSRGAPFVEFYPRDFGA